MLQSIIDSVKRNFLLYAIAGFLLYREVYAPAPSVVPTVTHSEARAWKGDVTDSYADACLAAEAECRKADAKLPNVTQALYDRLHADLKAKGAARFAPVLSRIAPEGSDMTPAQLSQLADFYHSLSTQMQKGWMPW